MVLLASVVPAHGCEEDLGMVGGDPTCRNGVPVSIAEQEFNAVTGVLSQFAQDIYNELSTLSILDNKATDYPGERLHKWYNAIPSSDEQLIRRSGLWFGEYLISIRKGIAAVHDAVIPTMTIPQFFLGDVTRRDRAWYAPFTSIVATPRYAADPILLPLFDMMHAATTGSHPCRRPNFGIRDVQKPRGTSECYTFFDPSADYSYQPPADWLLVVIPLLPVALWLLYLWTPKAQYAHRLGMIRAYRNSLLDQVVVSGYMDAQTLRALEPHLPSTIRVGTLTHYELWRCKVLQATIRQYMKQHQTRRETYEDRRSIAMLHAMVGELDRRFATNEHLRGFGSQSQRMLAGAAHLTADEVDSLLCRQVAAVVAKLPRAVAEDRELMLRIEMEAMEHVRAVSREHIPLPREPGFRQL